MVTHRNVIIGSELVSFLISSRVCSVRADAVDLCNHLIMDEILQHEFQEHIFKDKYLFYVITPEAHSNACAIGFNSDSDSDDEDVVDHSLLPCYIPRLKTSDRDYVVARGLCDSGDDMSINIDTDGCVSTDDSDDSDDVCFLTNFFFFSFLRAEPCFNF